ncbi:MAG: MOSC domain-containing protein [Bacteroidota bacterium]
MEIKQLQENFAQPGEITFIGVRPKRGDDVLPVNKVMAIEGQGLEGDHYQHHNGTRQVTLIQQEHLNNVASFLGKSEIDPSLPRRNIVVKGINLLALKGKQFQIGEAILEYSGECHPCSRMERILGTGGYNAMRGHGGITAKIIKGGVICVGDFIRSN